MKKGLLGLIKRILCQCDEKTFPLSGEADCELRASLWDKMTKPLQAQSVDPLNASCKAGARRAGEGKMFAQQTVKNLFTYLPIHLFTSKKVAFTLAEVLITLGIIGVVAALTLPSVITAQQEKATVTRLKKAYSTLSNALLLAINEHGTVDNWELVYSDEGAEGATNFYNKISPYIKTLKDCHDAGNCFYKGNYKTLVTGKTDHFTGAGGIGSRFYRFSINDGTAVAIWINGNETTPAAIFVDTNGNKGPNTTGKDAFWFNVKKDRIVPPGTTEAQFQDCAYNQNAQFPSRNCTAWVLYNENLDYLHCDDLSWNGKRKCK